MLICKHFAYYKILYHYVLSGGFSTGALVFANFCLTNGMQGYFWDGPEPFFEKTVKDRLNLI